MFGTKMKVVTELKDIKKKNSLIICAPQQILLGLLYKGENETRNVYTDWQGTVWHCYLLVH
jgi:hypothetical protein